MNEQLWSYYAFYANVLILKMMWIIWCTGRIRYDKKVIHSDMDRFFIKEPGVTFDVSGGGHPDVDRIRSAHRSDLQVVIPFLFVACLWMETNPSLFAVRLALQSFTLARVFHYVFYMEFVRVRDRVKLFTSVFSYAVLAYVTLQCLALYV